MKIKKKLFENLKESTDGYITKLPYNNDKTVPSLINEENISNVDNKIIESVIEKCISLLENLKFKIRYTQLPVALHLFEIQKKIKYKAITIKADKFKSTDEFEKYLIHLRQLIDYIIVYQFIVDTDGSFIFRYNIPTIHVVDTGDVLNSKNVKIY